MLTYQLKIVIKQYKTEEFIESMCSFSPKICEQKGCLGFSVYEDLEKKGAALFSGLKEAASAAGVEVAVNRIGSMGSMFFNSAPVSDFASAKSSDSIKFPVFYARMIEQGIYIAPSAFEAWFVSLAHDDESIQKTIDCAGKSLADL